MKFEGFIGPSSQARSPNADFERTFNLYLETGSGGGAMPKTRAALYGTPGLSLFGTLPTLPVRGLWANDTRLFAVGGSRLYEVFSNGTSTDRGDVGTDGKPVQIFPNGNQLLIASAGVAYCDNGSGPVAASFTTGSFAGVVNVVHGTFPAIRALVEWVSGDQFVATMAGQTITIDGTAYTVALFLDPQTLSLTTNPLTASNKAYSCVPALAASQGAFLDGYFIVVQPNSRQINISAIDDGTNWNALDFALKEGYPDNIAAILADHEELWVFGTDTTEVWQDTGDANFPLARIPGAFIHHGCIAPYSPVRLNTGVAWLSSDPQRGGIRALFAQGFQPTDISFKAVPTIWETYSTVADAVSFSYVEGGHEFWILTFPTANATWCFDATEGQWTQRGWWNGASNDRQRQMSHAYVFGKHIVGDWSNGKLYQQAVSLLDDNATAIHWERTAPFLADELEWLFFSRFQLDMEAGQSLVAPAVSLSWSDDGGHTFSTPIAMTPDKATYAGRLFRNRLGKSRARVFRVTGTSVAGGTRVALLEALVGLTKGLA
jgi:hypothetical protein